MIFCRIFLYLVQFVAILGGSCSGAHSCCSRGILVSLDHQSIAKDGLEEEHKTGIATCRVLEKTKEVIDIIVN